MRSTFFGIEIGKSGINVSQFGLDVTGHNVSNVETRGYTRQRVTNEAYAPFANIGKLANRDMARIGGGARVQILEQLRDVHLDRRFRTENTINGYWSARTSGLRYVESYFDNVNEETSISFTMARLFEAMKVLADDPVEGAPRTLLQTAGVDLAQQLNSVYDGLVELQSKHNLTIETKISDINRIAEQIADLNLKIYAFEITGHRANDLRDLRNVLIDDLSQIIDVEYREESDGLGSDMLIIEIGGKNEFGIRGELVNHADFNRLTTIEVANVIPGAPPSSQPIWLNRIAEIDGTKLTLAGDYAKTTVPRINRFAREVASLNDEITALTDRIALATDPNDQAVLEAMRDTAIADRQTAIENLQDLVSDITVIPGATDNDPIFLSALGEDMETGDPISVELVNADGASIITIGFEEGDPLVITGGELQAHIDMRDNVTNNQNKQGIPYFIEMLNDLARALTQEINRLHSAGWTDSLAPGGSQTGINFFDDSAGWYWSDDGGVTRYTMSGDGILVDEDGEPVLDGGGEPITDPVAAGFVRDGTDIDISLITAKNIRLSDDVLLSAYNIAASTVEVSRALPEELQRGNNENMNRLYTLFLDKDISVLGREIGSFDGYATTIRFDVANTLNFSRRTEDTSRVLTLAAENNRLSVSGVSLDEEMTNIIRYQHAYSGAARVITAMDEALDRLINGTGRVGL